MNSEIPNNIIFWYGMPIPTKPNLLRERQRGGGGKNGGERYERARTKRETNKWDLEKQT